MYRIHFRVIDGFRGYCRGYWGWEYCRSSSPTQYATSFLVVCVFEVYYYDHQMFLSLLLPTFFHSVKNIDLSIQLISIHSVDYTDLLIYIYESYLSRCFVFLER